jgi:sulfate-transporting ATPase
MKFGEPMSDDEMNKLLESRATLQDKIDAPTAGNLDRTLEWRWTRCAARPATRRRQRSRAASAPRRAVPAAAREARHAAARRADQPPRRRERRLARAHLQRDYPGTVVPSPTTATSSTTSPKWILELDRGTASPSRATTPLARAEAEAPGAGGEGRSPPSALGARARVGAHVAPARQAKSKARLSAYEELSPRRARRRRRRPRSSSRRPAPRRRGGRGQAPVARATATSCSSTTCPSRCRAAASSASSAPTAPARPRSSA